MHRSISLAALSALALTLSGCGDGDQERATTATADSAAAVRDDAAMPRAEETQAAVTDPSAIQSPDASDASPEPTSTPASTPSPTRSATPTPTPVAMVTPPAAFTQCGVCHSVKRGENGIGPSLAGVFGRRSAALPGFSYSPALREADLTWNQANLNRYLADPAGTVPGTTMALPGVSGAAERTAIINYLKTL